MKHSSIMRLYGLFLVFSLVFASAQAQLAFNTGADIYVQPTLDVYVQGGIYNQSGSWTLNGNLHVDGDIQNDDANNMFLDALPYGTTFLRASVDQTLSGTAPIHFPNLTFQGTAGNKVLQQNAAVRNTLAFGDRNMAANQFVMHVLSDDPTAVTTAGGFLAANQGGGLRRNTASTDLYYFPVGGMALGERRVNIHPQAATATSYTARLAAVDATTEGRDRNNRADNICEVNPTFYHQISSTANASQVFLQYLPTDAIRETVANWEPQWQALGDIADEGNGFRVNNWQAAQQNLAFASINIFNPDLDANLTTFCPNLPDPLVLTASVEPGAPAGSPYFYTFLNSAGAVVRAESNDPTFEVTTGTDEVYRVRIRKDGISCPPREATLAIDFRDEPTAAITPNNQDFCDEILGANINVTNPNTDWQYSWQRDNVEELPFGTTTTLNPTQAGAYTVIARDPDCDLNSAASNIATIRLAQSPTASFLDDLPAAEAPSPFPELPPATPVNVVDNSQFDLAAGDQIVSWFWDFGNGTTSNQEFPTPAPTYNDPGPYTITLRVTTDFGCTHTATRAFVVTQPFDWRFPNAFSPNNDGLNDTFEWQVQNVESFNFMVFNRWGEKIFETQNPTQYWDGRVGNQQAMEGVYVYRANGTNRFTGRKLEASGTITLIR